MVKVFKTNPINLVTPRAKTYSARNGKSERKYIIAVQSRRISKFLSREDFFAAKRLSIIALYHKIVLASGKNYENQRKRKNFLRLKKVKTLYLPKLPMKLFLCAIGPLYSTTILYKPIFEKIINRGLNIVKNAPLRQTIPQKSVINRKSQMQDKKTTSSLQCPMPA